MPITPSDIEHKTFSTALRGYDLDEVDDFLDEIVVALRDLHGELTAAKAKIAELEQSKPTSTGGGGDEASVGRVLILAQQAADQTVGEARVEADRLLEDARVEADRALEEARAEADVTLTEARTEADSFEADRARRRESALAEMSELSVLVAGVRNQLALLATTVADKLDEMDSTIDSADLDAMLEDDLEAGSNVEDDQVGDEEEDLEVIVDEADSGTEGTFAEMIGTDEMAEETDEADLAVSEIGESTELDLDATETEPEMESETEPEEGSDEADDEDEHESDDDEAAEDDEADDDDGEPENPD